MGSSSNQNSAPKPEVYGRGQHSLSRRDIDPDALKIMYRLINNGYKAYLVGGAVRDLLLGKKPKDFDIATDATPRRVKALFRNSRIIGRRFKLVHVLFGRDRVIEVATFRDLNDPIGAEDSNEEEPAPISRDNKYGTEYTDASRRDVTINALFYSLKNFSIIDYVGGMRDLTDGVVRVIGDPNVRYLEDPVRMIRVLRMAARLDFSVEDSAWEAIGKNFELILKSSPVRVYEEVRKDLHSGCFLQTLRTLGHTGLLKILFPEVAQSPGLLYDDASFLSSWLARADELTREREALGTSVIFALLCLSLTDNGRGDPLTFLQNEEEVEGAVKKTFAGLPLPRRERERIEHILMDFSELHRTPAEKIKVSKLMRREHYAELLAFLKIIRRDPEIIETIEGDSFSSEEKEEFEEKRRAQRQPRRRGGRRHAPRMGPRVAPFRR
jgi:poly(A) polymerase